MKGELNEAQIRNVLSSQSIGRLACVKNKQPYIVPVTYKYDGDYIYGQTDEGEKLSILRSNPKVCFETDMMTDMYNWQCVVVYGEFEELNNEEAEKARSILSKRMFSLMTPSSVHAHEHAVNAATDDSSRIKSVAYRVKIVKISGRYESR